MILLSWGWVVTVVVVGWFGCIYHSGLVSSLGERSGEWSAASNRGGRLRAGSGGNGGRRMVWLGCRSGFQRLGEEAWTVSQWCGRWVQERP